MRAWRSSNGPAWVIAAVAVALLGTVGALRLFVEACEGRIHSEELAGSANSLSSDPNVEAGQQQGDFPEADIKDTSEPAPEPIVVRLTLEQTVRVARLLEEAGLTPSTADRWTDEFQRVAHTRILASGRMISLYKDPATGELRGIRYDRDDQTAVVEQGYANGVLLVAQRPITYFVRPVSLTFAIADTFPREAVRHRIPKPVVESLEDAFQSYHPLDSLPPGSAVKLIYSEQVSRDGTHTVPGDLEAAQIRIGTRTMHAFAFRDEHGRAHLYDEHGRPLGPQVLRFPLPFEYISSGFTAARYHPILHRYRPHVGIDLVAQYGTPVKAIADGRVESSDWAGELGKCVRIEHDHGMVSIYGHLSRISPAATPGSYVKVGQVIGWVGSTGLSTGPHLHFALLREGRYVNPLSEKLGVNHEVSPRLRGLFDQVTQHYETLFAGLPDLGRQYITASERKPPISHLGDLYHVELSPRARIGRSASRDARPISVESANAGGL
jgi:murein DD-endopeptidase MepM/ murein hydrolase activator NlpD